jgi:hypothetical protein
LVISGHRPPAGLEEVKEYLRMLKQSIEWVRKCREKHMSLGAMQAGPVPEKWKAWENRDVINALTIPEWIQMVDDHLKRCNPHAEGSQ